MTVILRPLCTQRNCLSSHQNEGVQVEGLELLPALLRERLRRVLLETPNWKGVLHQSLGPALLLSEWPEAPGSGFLDTSHSEELVVMPLSLLRQLIEQAAQQELKAE